jgi:hypothetical protein
MYVPSFIAGSELLSDTVPVPGRGQNIEAFTPRVTNVEDKIIKFMLVNKSDSRKGIILCLRKDVEVAAKWGLPDGLSFGYASNTIPCLLLFFNKTRKHPVVTRPGNCTSFSESLYEPQRRRTLILNSNALRSVQ